MLTDIRLELEHVLEGEDIGDDLALSCMIDPITSIEESSVNRHKCIVEVALQTSVSVGIDNLEGVWVGD